MSEAQTGFWMHIIVVIFFVLAFIFGLNASLEVKKGSLDYINEGFASSFYGVMALLCLAFSLALVLRLRLRGF